jgi:glycosyltransferase involved in cell wall biosynthesis
MEEAPDLSVIVSTYNRCALLPGALESVLAGHEGVRYEVVVVDNNSTDGTRQVVESLIARGHTNLRYLFEERQGVSYARNTGIRAARAPIVAFFDDDVRLSPGGLAMIKRAFDEHPEVDFVGGKVLPEQDLCFPRWLTRDHWSPLAIQEYGEAQFYVDPRRPVCLISANLACRRAVFERIGYFSPALQLIKDTPGSTEDHELILRLWAAGMKGLYLPDLVAITPVPPDRLTKAYHRRWHSGHGRRYALMRTSEIEGTEAGRLFDVPAHLYRQALLDVAAWARFAVAGDFDRAFPREARLRFFAGFFKQRRRDWLATRRHGSFREAVTFVRSFTMRGARPPA